MYEANIPLILENHREGPVHSVYNKRLTNDVNINELMYAAEDIYQRQLHSFMLYMSFGVILIHTGKTLQIFQALRKRFGNGKSHFLFQKEEIYRNCAVH